MLSFAHCKDWINITLVFFEDQMLITEWLNSLKVIDGVTNQEVSLLFDFTCCTGQTFLEFDTDVVTSNNEGNTSQGNERFLPAENETNDKTTDECEEGLNVWSQTLTCNTIKKGTLCGHSTCKHTWLIFLIIKPSNMLLENWVVKKLSDF